MDINSGGNMNSLSVTDIARAYTRQLKRGQVTREAGFDIEQWCEEYARYVDDDAYLELEEQLHALMCVPDRSCRCMEPRPLPELGTAEHFRACARALRAQSRARSDNNPEIGIALSMRRMYLQTARSLRAEESSPPPAGCVADGRGGWVFSGSHGPAVPRCERCGKPTGWPVERCVECVTADNLEAATSLDGPDPDPTPDEEDAFITESRGGYFVTVEGRYVGTYTRWTRAAAAIYLHTHQERFFPNVWDVNERGNTTLLQWQGHRLVHTSIAYV